MADTRATNSEASKPGVSEHTRNVHGFVPNWIFPGAEAVHSVQCGVPSSCYIDML